jgi:hypothetical protein
MLITWLPGQDEVGCGKADRLQEGEYTCMIREHQGMCWGE